MNTFYAQGAHRALVDLGLEKDAAWPALVDIPALSRRVLAPIIRRLEQRELRQGLEQLRKALPTAQAGPVAGSVRLMGPNGQPVTVSSRALDEALGVTPITTTPRTTSELLPTPVTKSAGQLGTPSTSPSFKASPDPLAANKGPTQPVDVQMVPLSTGSVPGSVPGGTVGPKKEYAATTNTATQTQNVTKQADDQSLALPLASLGGAAALTPFATRRLLGYQRLYHGTPTAETAQRILKEGLQPLHGGEGASQAMNYATIEANKGRIHATPVKSIGRFYAGMEPDFVEKLRQEAFLFGPLPKHIQEGIRRGKAHPERLLKMDVPVTHPWEADPQHLPGTAVRSSEAVAPEFIHGGTSRLKRYKALLRELPASIKARPGRFALGLGGLGAMGALGTYGVSRLMDRS